MFCSSYSFPLDHFYTTARLQVNCKQRILRDNQLDSEKLHENSNECSHKYNSSTKYTVWK